MMDRGTSFAFSTFLLVTVSCVLCLGDSEPMLVSYSQSLEQLDKGFQKTAVFNEIDTSTPDLGNSDKGFIWNTEDGGISARRRKRRQVRSNNLIELFVSQECEGIVLRWSKPNFPSSTDFHSSNSEFSHYNIYRETNFFSSVTGLRPIASGRNVAELRNLLLEKWIDKFPPTGTGLFYAVTVVNNKGEEPSNVLPKQTSFFGSFDGVGGNPARIMPNIIQGNVMTHSVAYNNFRNEYFVIFDVDQNNDNIPDRVYGWRINGLGQILNRQLIDFTLRGATTEQGHPSVAFNPSTQEYLVTWHLSAPAIQGGAHIIIAQRVHGHRTVKKSNPFMLVNAKFASGFRPVTEPKLMYNAGSGGYVMTAMVNEPPKTLFVVFMRPDGKASSLTPLFKGEVLEGKLFMDTKHQQVYIVYQVPQWAVTLTSESDEKLKQYPYIILLSKANATGALLKLGSSMSVRYMVGYTRERNAHLDGFFDRNNGWLTVFWNNRENGTSVISSSTVVGLPGTFRREMNAHNCKQHKNVKNSVSCFLPTNNAHVMVWEEGARLGGYLVKDGAFNPVSGIQRSAVVIYNARHSRAFVVYQQTVSGSRVLFVKNLAPSSHSTCSPACRSSERCVMKDVCTPRNPVVVNNAPTCLKDNGGCSHTCTGLSNGRRCSCRASYTLALDGMKCFLTAARPDVSLLYSTVGSIWSASVYYAEKRVSFTRIPIHGQQIISFFYNAKDEYLYWADARAQKIFRAHLDGTNKQEIINNQVILPDGMIIDPKAGRLYWADGEVGTLFRSFLDGANVASFVIGIDKPRALSLHQKNGWLFWTSWGAVAKIERIDTNGSNRVVLVQSGLQWPNGLANDGKYLYWADARSKKIEMSDLDGNGRITVTTNGVTHPYGLGIAGNRLYWTDWTGHIRSLDKRQSYRQPDEIAIGILKPFSLQIYNGTALKASFCTDPGIPLFGGRNPRPTKAGGKYNIGDRILLTCNPGFVHLGSNDRRCLPTGKWSGSSTQCKALPVFTRLPRNKTVEVSYAATIECSADKRSIDKAVITWYKDGKVLGPSLRYYKDRVTDYLHIPRALVDDAGLYSCEAKNAAGSRHASMYLTVRQKQMACGKAKFTTRAKIIGGQRAEHGSIPWQILLFNNVTKAPFCGASLLNERWGITAAHCLYLQNMNNVVAILGEHQWNRDDSSEQRMSISEIHLHSQYNPSTFDSDIAVFKFTKQAIFTDYVIPVCLPTSTEDFALSNGGNVARISGWGARKVGKTRPVKRLHTVEIETVSHRICKANHLPKYIITVNMLCAGRTDGKGDACQGDSGGPLTVKNANSMKNVLVGIVSWGDRCGQTNKYGVYTKVKNYISWINNHIKNV